MNRKEIDQILKNRGINPKQWKDDVINTARMSIIDKTGDDYKQWEARLLGEKVFELLKKDAIENNQKRNMAPQTNEQNGQKEDK